MEFPLMRTRSAFSLAALLMLTAACTSVSPVTTAAPAPAPMAAPAPAPASVATIDPSGKWAVALTAQGQAFDFEMELRRISGAEFGGVVTSTAFPPMNVNKATLMGNTMKLTVTAPTGDEATFNIVFEGNVLTGDWSMPGDGSRISGRRK
jgi:hypothetical protein